MHEISLWQQDQGVSELAVELPSCTFLAYSQGMLHLPDLQKSF
jgi:hypothetical protein